MSGPIPYDADAPAAGRYRARQIHAVLRFTPLAILANALNVELVLWGTRESGPQPFLLGWAAMVLAMAGRGMVLNPPTLRATSTAITIGVTAQPSAH